MDWGNLIGCDTFLWIRISKDLNSISDCHLDRSQKTDGVGRWVFFVFFFLFNVVAIFIEQLRNADDSKFKCSFVSIIMQAKNQNSSNL